VLSESARMTSTAELRFRVQAPNSLPRATAIVSLDSVAGAFVRELATRTWNQARFLKAAPVSDAAMDCDDGWLWTLQGERTSIADEVTRADQVIMVAGPGGQASAVTAVGRECSRQRVTTTGLIVGAADASDRDVSRTLAQLRPWSLMVVMANTDEYIGDMMVALRV
jgi:hypothetical protein